jgi:hypothetical protein
MRFDPLFWYAMRVPFPQESVLADIWLANRTEPITIRLFGGTLDISTQPDPTPADYDPYQIGDDDWECVERDAF